jgi:hypothetical protein
LDIPVFVISRDRLSPLAELVAWLERAGCGEIYLVDNDSVYEPLLEYYERTPHTVLRLGRNAGKLALWEAPGVFDRTRGRPFVYTDPDVIPDEGCPLDALDRFATLLRRYPAVKKVGFGLRIDDLPDRYRHRAAVIAWERRMWEWPVERDAYYAPIDTTFALYPAGGAWGREAIRTGPPYVARHATWYADLDAPTEEEAFYHRRIAADEAYDSGRAHWSAPLLPESFTERVELAQDAPGRLALLNTRLRWRLRGRRTLRRVPPS